MAAEKTNPVMVEVFSYVREMEKVLGLAEGVLQLQQANKAPIGWLPITDISGAGLITCGNGGLYAVKNLTTNEVVTSFYIGQFPFCCAYAISGSVTMYSPYRGRGLNKIGLALRMAIAKAAGYTSLVCTDTEKNERERRTLARLGFKDIHSVINRRTNNKVMLSVRDLYTKE